MKSEDTVNYAKAGAIMFGLWGSYKFVIKPILELLQVIDDEEEKKIKDLEEKMANLKLWSSDYYKNYAIPKGYTLKLVTVKTAKNICKKINDAFGTFNDNEETIYGIFRNDIVSKSVLSWICQIYFETYNEDLYEYLKYKLSDEEFLKVLKIVDDKPVGLVNIKTGEMK